MKTFEDFKSEITKLAEVYNNQDHRVDGSSRGLKITIKPVFADYSNDGYEPQYSASFIVYWGDNHRFNSGRFIKYLHRLCSYQPHFKGHPQMRAYKSVRKAFSCIYDI